MPKLQLPRDPAVTYRGAASDNSSDRELALIALLQLPQRRAIHAKMVRFLPRERENRPSRRRVFRILDEKVPRDS